METLTGIWVKAWVSYQTADKDFNFLEAQVREIDTERNQSVLTSIFRTLTGTRHRTRRRQVTSIPPTPIILGARGITVIPSVAAILGMPETTVTQTQEVLATTTDLGTPTRVDQEVSMPETTQPARNAKNKSQLGVSYLNSHFQQVIPNSNIYVCSSDSFMQKKS